MNPTVKYIRPILIDIGKATLRRKFPYFSLVVDVRIRIEYMQRVMDYWRKVETKGDYIKRDLCQFELNNRIGMYNYHMQYLRECEARLDITNTMDTPSKLAKFGVPDWVPETFSSFEDFDEFRKDWLFYKERYPQYVLDQYFDMPVKPPVSTYDLAEQLLIKQTYASRRAEYLQRLMNQVNQCHLDGWFFIFDTLTLSPESIKDFANENKPIRNYVRRIARLVGKSAGLPKSSSTRDVYKYFCVPEYGDKNGRLHFHILHMCKYLPAGTVDPAAGVDFLGRSLHHRREIDSFKGHWSYGQTKPIAVRYAGDNFTRKGWCAPIDKNTGHALVLKPVEGVIYYISKYVSKNLETAKAEKLKRNKRKWRILISQYNLPQTLDLFRVSMSRGLGMSLPSMAHLSMLELQQLICLHWKTSNLNVIVRKNAREELALRMGEVTCLDILTALPSQTNMLKQYRDLMNGILTSNQLSFIRSKTKSLTPSDICNNVKLYLQDCGAYAPDLKSSSDKFSGL